MLLLSKARPHAQRTARNVVGAREQGAALLVVLLLLVLVTIVSYDAMETSSLEARMAVAREGKEISFQAAEAIIDQAKNDPTLLEGAYAAQLSGGSWPTSSYSFADAPGLSGNAEVRYRAEIASLGNDIVIGNPGLRSVHFEVRASASRGDDRLDSEHIQGIRRFAPKLP